MMKQAIAKLSRPISGLVAAGFLLGGALGLPGTGLAASFNCATNTAPDEKAICADCELAQMDVKMAAMFEFLSHTSAMGGRGALQDAQRAWLSQRASCGADRACLRAAYTTRIGQLQHQLDDFYSRGPY